MPNLLDTDQLVRSKVPYPELLIWLLCWPAALLATIGIWCHNRKAT